MRIGYYPGCTLKSDAQNFEISALAVLKEIGYDVKELSRWNCCGTVYSLASDDLMHQLAPFRNLIRAKEEGYDKILTLCSMCYNTIKRANLLVQKDKEKLDKLNNFMYEENTKYDGSVDVIHILNLIKDTGIKKIKEKVKKSLRGLSFAPYYGCLLLRPKEIAIDDMELPEIMEEIISVTGADVIDFPFKTECCGSYHTIKDKDVVLDKTYSIVNLAHELGASAILLSCPLCDFNLEARQNDCAKKYLDFKKIPVLYFTQVLALAFGLPEETWGFKYNKQDPLPIFKEII
uniref:Heterodisulfide reductase, subunit B n=1 Tax=candidate division WOR-3 bacterium TaxID=2052148 RepID=A0A7C4UCP4_UNCW3